MELWTLITGLAVLFLAVGLTLTQARLTRTEKRVEELERVVTGQAQWEYTKEGYVKPGDLLSNDVEYPLPDVEWKE